MARNIILILATLSLMLVAASSWASEAQLMAEINALKAKLAEVDALKMRIADLEKRVESQGCAITTQTSTVSQIRESLIKYEPGEGVKMPPCGIEVTAGATFVLQGTPNSNNNGTKEAARFDAAWSSDIFIKKAFEDWGMALIHLEPGQGKGAEEDLYLYSNVNRDQNDTNANVPVTELWYEHYLFNKQVAITAGKMDPANYIDQNEYAHDETTQFIGRIFRQNPAIEWPYDNTLAARLIYAPEYAKYISLEGAYFDAENDWENVLEKPFVAAQINFKPSKLFNIDTAQWAGNYRFYWWLNGRDHSKLVEAGESPADNTKNVNMGFGFSFDQMVTEIYGVFTRFGWQSPDIALAATSNVNSAPCDISWSGGVRMIGKYWNREKDVLGLAAGQVFPKSMMKNVDNHDGGAAESHFEAYYKFQVLKWLAITPDIQWIWNPRGVNNKDLGEDNTIFVYGIRGQIDL